MRKTFVYVFGEDLVDGDVVYWPPWHGAYKIKNIGPAGSNVKVAFDITSAEVGTLRVATRRDELIAVVRK